ncbi:Radical SAM domain protein [Clostridium sp. DL-VIII]|uniref:radical SAM/SPASM domain-containing protein n=1 Tax=Clostridium sp. DL-VIII TaxID=641107 RepID=UPI00023B02EF|nr:radical SAM protein [Clostridium sp. DL-VIII]EHJ01789.1 Radical SAM domain protein [Clostridium sp. DL-VIII]
MKLIKSAQIDITYKCNFRCKHCFNSSGEHNNGLIEMTEDQIIKNVNEFLELGVDSLCCCGGEALLRKDIVYKVGKTVKNYNDQINVALVSNGYLIDEEVAYNLAENGIKSVQISIDGANSEEHDWMRNMPGSYERAIQAVDNLVKNGINVETAFVPTEKNIKDLGNAIDNAYNLGISNFRIQPAMSLGRAKKNLNDYLLDYNGFIKYKSILDKKKIQYINQNFTIEWGDPLEHLRFIDGVKKSNIHVAVNAYGDILISPYLPIAFGNVKKASIKQYMDAGLKDVWDNEFLKAIISKIHSVDDMDLSRIGLPEIYLDKNIDLDLLNDNYEEKTKKLLLELGW